MAEKYGFGAIEDGLVTLLNTNIATINTGLSRTVKKIATLKPDNIVLKIPEYPAICVYFDFADRDFRGASKRIETIGRYRIDYWTHDRYSIDATKDQADLLADNLLYVLDSNIDISNFYAAKGYILAKGIRYDYNTNDSGFITHGVIELEVRRYQN